MPYGQNPPLWGQNPYQQGWPPPYETTYRPLMPFNTELPSLATLELSDVSHLMNDPILHSPYWPLVPSKFRSNFPKFDGKEKEDPQAHLMTYHLWCSSNSYVDDSIRLCLFQKTLTGVAAKWYIELP